MGEQTGKKRGGSAFLTIVLVAIIAAIGAVFMMYRPDFSAVNKRQDVGGYVVLYKNLELSESALIIEELKTQGIKNYRIADEGKTILVPAKKKDEIAIGVAKKGIMPNGGTVGFEIFDKGGALGATEFDKQIKYSRAVSGELARSIMRINIVEEARVQIVIPEKQLFSTQKNPVQASVFVKVIDGELLTPAQVDGIVSLVASSVEDLKKKNVTVVDYAGKILSNKDYPKEYERQRLLLMSGRGKSNKGLFGQELVTDQALPSAEEDSSGLLFGFLKPRDKKAEMTKADRDIMKLVKVRDDMSLQETFAAKLKFKEDYELLLEKKVRVITDQFFPPQAVQIKVSLEMNNLKIVETVSPNSLISRVNAMILLDQDNKDVVLTPEIREALMKSIASVLSYVRGRDTIDLRWAPINVRKKQGLALFAQRNKPETIVVKDVESEEPTAAAPETLLGSKLAKSAAVAKMKHSWNMQALLVYGLGIAGVLLVVLGIRSLFGKKKSATAEQKSIFEDEQRNPDADFSDLQSDPVAQMKDMAEKSPEAIASVLEKWFQEDEQ